MTKRMLLVVATVVVAAASSQAVSAAQARSPAAADGCRPLRAVFYAASEWLRLATALAANPSPCAEYYVSIPPIVGDKTNFRADQAWRIRALGPTFHALAEVHAPAWRAWVTGNTSTWYAAGVEARRRMAAKGFDVTLGDGWVVNEFSSAVRRGTGVARTEMRDFVHGLYDGDGGPPTKGGVFDVGVGQGGDGPGATDLWTYKSQLEGWLQDGAFWTDMSRYVSDWSQELYGDVRNYAVAGAPLAARRDTLDDYLRHQLVHARLGGSSTAAAEAFLEGADSPLANAAWQWDSGFGWTAVSAALMEDYVSTQVYALRHFSALEGEPADHWGFAWAPHNATGIPAADFATQTGAILDRLAAAIHDSGEGVNPSDPGIGACGPLGQNLWCSAVVPGAWLNDSWKAFTYWGQLALAFATPPRTLVAGGPSQPLVVATHLGGSAYNTPNALVVTVRSSSPQGRFSTNPAGPWTSVATLTVSAGGHIAPTVYYKDALAGAPVLTAGALGATSGSQTQVVVAPASPVPPPPAANRRPRIVSARLVETRRGPRAAELLRIRYCDDSEGRLLATVTQLRKTGKRIRAKGSLARTVPPTGGGCRTASIAWRATGKFVGRGTYRVKLRLRDAAGAWSSTVVRSRQRRR